MLGLQTGRRSSPLAWAFRSIVPYLAVGAWLGYRHSRLSSGLSAAGVLIAFALAVAVIRAKDAGLDVGPFIVPYLPYAAASLAAVALGHALGKRAAR